ncbi:MAG: biotin/lipoyl-containing protein, partial [Gemmatimonadota bacterium]
MAKVDVIMPQMGESIAEGTLTKWLKQIGDSVERDEDLFEISTDKVDADIPSPASGTLVEILVEEGATVEVNSIVARIETEAGAAVAAEVAPAEETAAAAEREHTEPVTEPVESPASAAEGKVAAPATEPGSREDRLQSRSTPLVRKIAAEHDVDISNVVGSGIAGRVTRDDITAYIAAREAGEDESAPASVPAAKAPAPTA